MKFEYKFDEFTLRVLDESYALGVLDFCTRNKSRFDAVEVSKPDNFYTYEFQRKLLAAEYESIIQGKYIRFYLVENSAPDTIIGTVSFSDIKRNGFYSCQTGYKIDRSHASRCFGTKMMREAIKIMITEYGMHRISAYILPDNTHSIRIVEKLGFELEGTARSYALLNGRWTDHLHYVYITDLV